MKKLSGTVLALLLLGAGPAATEESAPVAPAANRLEILDAERASYASLSFEATIEVPKGNNRTSRFPMFFEYRAPDKYRAEIRTGGFEGNQVTVADGTFIWVQDKRGTTRQRQERAVAAVREKGPADLLTVLATPTLKMAELFRLHGAVRDSGEYLLELTPLKPVEDYDSIILVTTGDGKTPVAAEAFRGTGIVAYITFTRYVRDPEIAADRFVFAPAPNVRVREIDPGSGEEGNPAPRP